MAEGEKMTCEACGAEFSYEEMGVRDADDDQNTQVGWLLGGRCPKCSSTVSLSFDQLQQIASNLSEADE